MTAGALLGVLALAVVVIGSPAAFLGTDATGWLPYAMIVAGVAGYLAVLLTLGEASARLMHVVLPMLGAVAAFVIAGGVLFGLGSGSPLQGPVFGLALFTAPGVYLTAGLSLLAGVASAMGTPPHRGEGSRSVG